MISSRDVPWVRLSFFVVIFESFSLSSRGETIRYRRGGATMTTAVLANDTQYIIPAADMDFFQQLAKRMGWAIRPKTEIDQAINDFETGNVRTFETVDQMMDYLNE